MERNILVGASEVVAQRLGVERGTTLGALSVIVAEDGTPYVNFVSAGPDGQPVQRQFGPNDPEAEWGNWRSVTLYGEDGQEIGNIGFDLPQPGDEGPFEFGIYDLDSESSLSPEGHPNPIQWAVAGDGGQHYNLEGGAIGDWRSMGTLNHEDRRGMLNLDTLEGMFRGEERADAGQERQVTGLWSALFGQSFGETFGFNRNIQVADVPNGSAPEGHLVAGAAPIDNDIGRG